MIIWHLDEQRKRAQLSYGPYINMSAAEEAGWEVVCYDYPNKLADKADKIADELRRDGYVVQITGDRHGIGGEFK